MLSYYEILGIGTGASNEEIQAAYDALIKQCYANLRDPKTHNENLEKIKQLTQARDHLLNTELRRKFDAETSMKEIAESMPPSPWRRFFARSFDQLIFISIFYLVYRYFADYVFFEDWIFALAAGGVGIVLYILLETAEISLIGTTLGKLMLSVRTTTTDGQKPNRMQLLKRNLIISLCGYALYIPPFSIVALALHHRKQKKQGNDGVTAWDRACGTAAEYGQIDSHRLLIILPFCLLALIDLINAL